MKNHGGIAQIILGLLLVVLSAVFYFLHFIIFRDAHHIFIYLVGDIAFVFIEVLLVTLIIHQMLSHREKRSMFKKLNMVIGAFFSEVGTELLQHFSALDANPKDAAEHLIFAGKWSASKFARSKKSLLRRDIDLHCKRADLEKLRSFIIPKRGFLLRLIENPNLLEHEQFTELLWAVFHLNDELSHRKTITEVPDNDVAHLAGDIKRAYILLLREWIGYMQHLKEDYPYLFSLALRTNPFDPDASVEVK